MRTLAVGFGLGFFVALQLGPMALFLIRSTLRGGLAPGLSIATGIAAVDGLYAMLGALGAASLLTIDPLRVGLGVAGAIVLGVLGVRMLLTGFRVRTGLDVAADLLTPRQAFLSALAGTASNPATIVSWAAIFTAASVASDAAPLPLVVGVLLGSLAWMVFLASAVTVVRRMVGPRIIRTADVLAGAGLIAFAGVLGCRAATTDA